MLQNTAVALLVTGCRCQVLGYIEVMFVREVCRSDRALRALKLSMAMNLTGWRIVTKHILMSVVGHPDDVRSLPVARFPAPPRPNPQ